MKIDTAYQLIKSTLASLIDNLRGLLRINLEASSNLLYFYLFMQRIRS